MTTTNRRNDLFSAAAVALLLIGTASGSAYAMLVMGLILLVLMAAYCPRETRHGAAFVVFVAFVTAAAAGYLMTWW